MQPLPNRGEPLATVNEKGAYINASWAFYLQQFTQKPPPFINLGVVVSPFEYEAKEPGYIIIAVGGTVTIVHLIRGAITIDITGQRIIPVSIGDIVEITSGPIPTVYFVPIYGSVAG